VTLRVGTTGLHGLGIQCDAILGVIRDGKPRTELEVLLEADDKLSEQKTDARTSRDDIETLLACGLIEWDSRDRRRLVAAG
jgi:hypothetical protein